MIRDRSLVGIAIGVGLAVLTFVALDVLRLELLAWWHREVNSS